MSACGFGLGVAFKSSLGMLKEMTLNQIRPYYLAELDAGDMFDGWNFKKKKKKLL